jgi:UDP-N-acetylglucosamine--N-acetylmuramyl-(pentapeptide) pyrophosphoryl-undecaprenol N-acetylglucosamine transferase
LSAGEPTIHLVAARGGHLELLLSLRGVFEGYRRTWITEPSARATALAADGERVHLVPPYGRSPRRLATHLAVLSRVLRASPPSLVVSGGGGLSVPTCALSRAVGARVVMLETMARITGPSVSGRVVSRLACAVLVQWPEMGRAYRRAEVCRPALLEGLPLGAPAPAGRGTLVAVGTEVQPFDRMLRLVDDAAMRGLLPEPIVAQTGHCRYQPRHFGARAWLPPDELQSLIGGARTVICHAGSGIVSAALRAGRRPLVMPRLARHGEMVDDHQLQLAGKLAELGLVVQLGTALDATFIAEADRGLPPNVNLPDAPALRTVLGEAIGRLGAPAVDGAISVASGAAR